MQKIAYLRASVAVVHKFLATKILQKAATKVNLKIVNEPPTVVHMLISAYLNAKPV